MENWCMYDISNERIMYCEPDDMPTDEEIKANIIKISVGQAEMIRRVKGLPMPSPPVEVVVGRPVESTDFEKKD